MDIKRIIPFMVMPLLLLAVEIGSILISLPVQAAGITAFEDPTSIANPFIFILILLVFTGFLLLLIKFDLKKVIAAVIGFSIFLTFGYIFAALVSAALGPTDLAFLVILVLSVLATVLLYAYPEWYVIDSLGILIGAGVASIFGVSLDILPVIVLLRPPCRVRCHLGVQDKTHDHACRRSDRLKTPILFVVPKRRDYSFIRDGIGKLDEGGERAAFIIGMGDLIMPSILVVSANVFL